MHRKAALFLRCGEAVAPARAIITHKLLIKTCRAEQARTHYALLIHRRGCICCGIPHQ